MNHFGIQAALWLLRLYQVGFSTLFGPACRFEPSCSQYAVEAFEKFGLARGFWLAAQRIARCHPFGGSGHDPIPERVGDGS